MHLSVPDDREVALTLIVCILAKALGPYTLTVALSGIGPNCQVKAILEQAAA